MESKEAKLRKLTVKNFKNVSNIEIEINGKILNLVGGNGSGKTTIGHDAILTAFRGIANRQKKGEYGIVADRFEFIKKGEKSADIILEIEDVENNAKIMLKNHLTHSKNGIEFSVIDGPEGYTIDREWLFGLLNEKLLSASYFCSFSPKEQAEMLGVKVDEIDNTIKLIKSTYTTLNRDLKKLGTIDKIEEVEKVDVTTLLKERDAITERNNAIDREISENNSLRAEIDNAQNEAIELQRRLEEANAKIAQLKEEYLSKSFKTEDDKESTDEINEKISNSQSINEKYYAYQDYIRKQKEIDSLKMQIETNREELKDKTEERLTIVKAAKLPFKNMEIDEEGQLTLNKRFIKHYSTGQKELIVARIAASLNPNFKLRFIDNWETIDEENREKLLKALSDENFDIITAQVGNEKKGPNTIVIRDGEIIE